MLASLKLEVTMIALAPKQICSYGHGVLIAALVFRNGKLGDQISYLHVLQQIFQTGSLHLHGSPKLKKCMPSPT
jgi:hypothetical protein